MPRNNDELLTADQIALLNTAHAMPIVELDQVTMTYGRGGKHEIKARYYQNGEIASVTDLR